jgi:putative transposase
VFDIDKILGLGVDISEKTKPHEWEKLSWRWIVERTFSWLNDYRRMSEDYGIYIASAEAVVKISQAHTLLKRL